MAQERGRLEANLYFRKSLRGVNVSFVKKYCLLFICQLYYSVMLKQACRNAVQLGFFLNSGCTS